MEDKSMEEPEANSGEKPTQKKASKKVTKKVKDELLVKRSIPSSKKLLIRQWF
jgi:hypothetical protein